MGQSGCSYRLSQPGQLTIRDELLGYHNNNNNLTPVNTLRLNPSQTGQYSIYLPRRDGRLS